MRRLALASRLGALLASRSPAAPLDPWPESARAPIETAIAGAPTGSYATFGGDNAIWKNDIERRCCPISRTGPCSPARSSLFYAHGVRIWIDRKGPTTPALREERERRATTEKATALHPPVGVDSGWVAAPQDALTGQRCACSQSAARWKDAFEAAAMARPRI